MFTGIIETIGTILNADMVSGNLVLSIRSDISSQLKVDQSVSHDGICLTVTEVSGNTHKVTAIQETLDKTNLGNIQKGKRINLERCLQANGRFDGHIVQGHVDQTAECINIEHPEGSHIYTFRYKPSYENMLVEKGSITVNGVSLTVVDPKENIFSVAIIPYTFEHTGFSEMKSGDHVNLEFDILGKYVAKALKYLQNES